MGQKSAVDRLPEKLRNKLIEMLHNPAITQTEIVDAINAEAGEPLVSRSSVNRYARRMKRFAEKNRQAKEVADAYIEKFGAEDRNKLLEMLHNPAVTQMEIVDAINAEAGEPLVSQSSLNRYAQRMKKFAEKNRQAKEVADAYIEKFGAEDRNKLGKVVNEQIRLAAFDLISEIDELKESGQMDPELITEIIFKVSRGLKDLEQAEKLNAERSETIRKATLAEAAEIVEQNAKSDGLSVETVEKIKKQILGL
jgi:HPt (histidine-containing phosphotransfer) domain-containing protein